MNHEIQNEILMAPQHLLVKRRFVKYFLCAVKHIFSVHFNSVYLSCNLLYCI